MEGAVDKIKEILNSVLELETLKLKEEINRLNDQVTQLKEELKVKDLQCRHIATVLHEKNSEWKRIKEKLTGNRRRNVGSKENDNSENKIIHGKTDAIDTSYTPDDTKDTTCNTISSADTTDTITSADTVDTTSHLDTSSHLDTISNIDTTSHINTISRSCADTDMLLDDSTQLPYKSTSSPSPPSSPHNQTQSNLDTLIDLISGDDDETVNCFGVTRRKSFVEMPQIFEGRKRKGHARGCSCCEKYYTATRSQKSSSTATANGNDSVLVSPNTPPGFWDTSFTPHQ